MSGVTGTLIGHDTVVDDVHRVVDALDVSPVTQRVYRRVLRRMVAQLGDQAKDPDAVRAWGAATVDARTPLGTRTVTGAALGAWLRAHGDTSTERVLPRARHQVQGTREALTEDELAQAQRRIAAIDMPAARDVLRVLMLTGMRVSEACGLRVDDVTTQHGKPVLRVIGKRSKVRVLPRGQALDDVLAPWVRDADEHKRAWLFPGRRGPLAADTVRCWLRKARMATGLDLLTPHVFRHTFASRMHDRGVDLRQIQVILGHANIATTSRYVHPSLSALEAAMEKG